MCSKSWVFVILCLCVLSRTTFSATLTADQVVEKLIAASEDEGLIAKRNSFSYRRASQVDYLDAEGKSRHKVERIYQIKPANREVVTKLLMVNGKPASEKADSKRTAARQTGEKSRTLRFNKELMDRFQYILADSTMIDGRSLHVLRFSPKPDAESGGFFDQLINAMHGTLWIDQEDFQLMKADVHLGQKVSFFGGLAGAIEKLDLTLLQKRLEAGVWLPQLTLIDFSGRKLLSDMKFRCLENCFEFEKTSIAQANTTSSSAGKGLN